MIEFQSVTKSYRVGSSRKTVLNEATFRLPLRRNLAVLGINGAGKSTLLKLISGAILPDRGRVRHNGLRVSWPLGFSGAFHAQLSGRENVRFAARIYGASIMQVTRFVEDFAELGPYLDEPVKTYSSGMKARLAFGLSMAIEFDVYLVDELTAVGDLTFRKRCETVFSERRKTSDIIMVSHSMTTLHTFCDSGCVLNGGRIFFHERVSDAITDYENMIKR